MRVNTCTVFLAAALFGGCAATTFPIADGPDAPLIADAAGPATDGAPFLSRLAAAEPKYEESFIAARAGFLFPGTADTSYAPVFTLGAFYPGELPPIFGFDLAEALKLESILFEAGVDLAWIQSRDLVATLALFRFDCLFSPPPLNWGATWPVPDVYGVVGYQFIFAGGDFATEAVSAIDLGVGAAWAEKKFDARFTLSILLGSKNIDALWGLTGGYTF